MQLIQISLFWIGISYMSVAQAGKPPAVQARVPAKHASQPALRSPANAREISEAIDITGQSRNLSMGLMFQRDKDKLSFGSPRTNYKDKITSQQTNY